MLHEKYPELWAQFEALKAERAALEERTAPISEARDALLEQMRPLEAKVKELNTALRSSRPRKAQLDNQIGALARAMGARSMSVGPIEIPVIAVSEPPAA